MGHAIFFVPICIDIAEGLSADLPFASSAVIYQNFLIYSSYVRTIRGHCSPLALGLYVCAC